MVLLGQLKLGILTFQNDVFKIIDSSYEIDKNAINNLVVLTYLFKLKYPDFIKKNIHKITNSLKWLHSDCIYFNFVKNDILNPDRYKFLKKCIYIICYEKCKMKYDTFKNQIAGGDKYRQENFKEVFPELHELIKDSFNYESELETVSREGFKKLSVEEYG